MIFSLRNFSYGAISFFPFLFVEKTTYFLFWENSDFLFSVIPVSFNEKKVHVSSQNVVKFCQRYPRKCAAV